MDSPFALLSLSFVESYHISIFTTLGKQSMINGLSNPINWAAKISKVMSSNKYRLTIFSFIYDICWGFEGEPGKRKSCCETQVNSSPKFLGAIKDDPLSVFLELFLLEKPVGVGVVLVKEAAVLLQLPQKVLQEVIWGHSREVPLKF